jgi:hypothetical protein
MHAPILGALKWILVYHKFILLLRQVDRFKNLIGLIPQHGLFQAHSRSFKSK